MENLINIVANRLAQNEQKADRDAMEETSLQRISREAAEEIFAEQVRYISCERDSEPNTFEMASIIYKHFRNGKEL